MLHCQWLQDHSCVCWVSVALQWRIGCKLINNHPIPKGGRCRYGMPPIQIYLCPLSISMAIQKQKQWLTSLKRKRPGMHSWKTVACSCEWHLYLGHQKILGRGCMRTYAQCLQWLIISALDMCFHLRTGRPLGQRSEFSHHYGGFPRTYIVAWKRRVV